MQKFNIDWTAKSLVNQMNKGAVNFDTAIQRGLVWDLEKKSLLIHSMIYGYAIPAMYFTREDGVYNGLDGKQRSNAISEYMNDGFSLAENTPPVYNEDGQQTKISGLKYSQLPEWAQDAVKDYPLTIYYYDDMTEDEAREFFRRLNNGKPLSAMELTRVQTPSLKDFQTLAKHPAIRAVLTDKARSRFTDETIAMQIYHLATAEHPDFSTKSFRAWAREVRVDKKVMENIRGGLFALNDLLAALSEEGEKKVSRKIKTRTHFVSAAYYCYLGACEKLSWGEMADTLRTFFSGKPSISDAYNATVTAGSAKPHAVESRRDAIRALVPHRDAEPAVTPISDPSPEENIENKPITAAENPVAGIPIAELLITENPTTENHITEDSITENPVTENPAVGKSAAGNPDPNPTPAPPSDSAGEPIHTPSASPHLTAPRSPIVFPTFDLPFPIYDPPHARNQDHNPEYMNDMDTYDE